jgi:Flp pilus assembly protein TadB
VTTMDLELETWRSEWRTQTEPLPALKKKIRRQNLQTVAAVATIIALLIVAASLAVHTRSSFWAGLAAGIGFAGMTLGSFAWWVRQGAWKPAAQTTLAYLELSYKRAIARARTLQFSFYFLLITTMLFAALVAWDWKALAGWGALILAAMILELFFLRHLHRRKKLEIEETNRLIEQTRE